jgi:hypothetical protein
MALFKEFPLSRYDLLQREDSRKERSDLTSLDV